MNGEAPVAKAGLRRRELLAHAVLVGGASLIPLRLGWAQEAGQEAGQGAGATGTPAPEPFGFDAVHRLAEQLAGSPHEASPTELPKALQELDYDRYRGIRFRPDHALWRGERLFEVQFFHLGFHFNRPVRVNRVSDGVAQPIPFRQEAFDYGGSPDLGDLPPDLGFAGFRVHYPLHGPEYKDELAVFLGASYFRVLGRHQVYGLSARGLAIDTAEPHGEEFPWFREFWIEEPAPDATALTLYALLDSPSCTGAYRFVIRPGTNTATEVDCTIHPRRDISKLGLAPLTSMFLYGENRTRNFDDFRPEVHDSDGLQVATATGERIWRPLMNPRNLRASASILENPRGFGLCQRDRDFDHYQDLEAHYHKRPSYWVEPKGDWGKGRVELIEIPTEEEIHDNIVAYWVSDSPVRKGQPVTCAYTLYSVLDMPRLSPAGRAVSTRLGSARSPGRPDVPAEARHFVLDFEGGDLPHLDSDEPVEAIVTASTGSVQPAVVQKNTETGGWRIFFDFLPDGSKASDLRCYLSLRGSPLTETWTYLWTQA